MDEEEVKVKVTVERSSGLFQQWAPHPPPEQEGRLLGRP